MVISKKEQPTHQENQTAKEKGQSLMTSFLNFTKFNLTLQRIFIFPKNSCQTRWWQFQEEWLSKPPGWIWQISPLGGKCSVNIPINCGGCFPMGQMECRLRSSHRWPVENCTKENRGWPSLIWPCGVACIRAGNTTSHKTMRFSMLGYKRRLSHDTSSTNTQESRGLRKHTAMEKNQERPLENS